ncbi:hypothetical protein ACLB2K_017645 [Fragaria x ananassa]
MASALARFGRARYKASLYPPPSSLQPWRTSLTLSSASRPMCTVSPPFQSPQARFLANIFPPICGVWRKAKFAQIDILFQRSLTTTKPGFSRGDGVPAGDKPLIPTYFGCGGVVSVEAIVDGLQAYIEASEIMLKEDVDTNKAIGSHGATFIQRHLENSKRICMLTHCNTGSLATAGYGTVLGVIRSLHTEGVLERAYCTETRPFNQGSRLTAYELVHDNIPATLLADSAAAALMKDGRVHAIVVGADRVASNGDTANKIGTYSLAVSAMYHNIPFFVAAPLTSVDLSLSSGGEIVIEERSPKELLNTHGGLGEQVAASGISVWNPAFDVTPSSLISGIITEKGVITKKGTDAFDIKGFVQNP